MQSSVDVRSSIMINNDNLINILNIIGGESSRMPKPLATSSCGGPGFTGCSTLAGAASASAAAELGEATGLTSYFSPPTSLKTARSAHLQPFLELFPCLKTI